MGRVYLLDTHILLWWLAGNNYLSDRLVETIKSQDNLVYCSVASLWEIAIKTQIGKITLKIGFEKLIESVPFSILSIQKEHIVNLTKLENYHKDPFDRILLAQTLSLGAMLITADSKLKKYSVPVWLISVPKR